MTRPLITPELLEALTWLCDKMMQKVSEDYNAHASERRQKCSIINKKQIRPEEGERSNV